MPEHKRGKGKRYGRNEVKCNRYELDCRREKNKKRKIRRHLKTHEADSCAREALKRI